MEAKIFVWKFSVIERKHRIPSKKVFSGLSKAHFKCPVQHFEKEVMEVKFTFCGLFRALYVFFYSDRKVSQVCQKHKPSVQSKKVIENFSVANVFSKHFQILSREIWSLTKKYQHVCHNYILWVRRNTSE